MTLSVEGYWRPRGGGRSAVLRFGRAIWLGLLLGGGLASACHRKPVTHLPEPVYEEPTLPVFDAKQPAARPADDLNLDLEAGEWAGEAPPGSGESPQDVAPSDAAPTLRSPQAPQADDLDRDASDPGESPTPRPVEYPAPQPSEGPAAQPSEGPAAQPSEGPAEQPSEGPAEQPSEGPAEQPSEGPAEQGPTEEGPAAAYPRGVPQQSEAVKGSTRR